MSDVIQTKRVVVSSNGEEFDNRTAFLRQEHQAKHGQARSRIKLKRTDQPLVRHDDE